MTDNVIAIDFNGVKIILDSNTVLKRLVASATTVNLSWHDSVDGGNYQVPTGKKAMIIFLEDLDIFGTREISSTTVVDSATGKIVIIAPGVNTNFVNVLFLSASIAADLFITTTGGALNGTPGTIWLLEETA